MEIPVTDIVLDTCGLYCPDPLMLLHAKIASAKNGQVIKLIATDPATERDVRDFCHFLKHELLARTQEVKQFYYWIRVRKPPEKI